MTIFLARSASVPALKKKPAAMSTCGGAGVHSSRATASLSKIAQIGPPPLWLSSIPASAAFKKLLGFHSRFLALSQLPWIGIERVVVVGNVLTPSLIVEALAEHVDQDQVLSIRGP